MPRFNEQLNCDFSKYIWGDRLVNDIREVTLSWGDLPIYKIYVKNDTVRLCRKINGSRDGWMSFPSGFFDEKNKVLSAEEKQGMYRFLETMDFSEWKTDDRTILNIEHGAIGFCVTQSFSCVFNNGTTFYCAYPPSNQFDKLIEYFKNFFQGESFEPFYLLGRESKTKSFDSATLQLTIKNSGKTVPFQKAVVEVGRAKTCDLLLEGKPTISRHHAKFYFEDNTWFLLDNFSTNGTWLNGSKIQPGKKYRLASNDEIDFAMIEKVIFLA